MALHLKRLACLLCVAALAAGPRHAAAQNGPWAEPFETPLRSQINEQTLDLARDVLHLSDDQRVALGQMLRQHEQRFAELVATAQPQVTDFQTRLPTIAPWTPPWFKVALERERVLGQVADEQTALDEGFLQRIQSILAAPQLENFQRFVQRFNRKRWMHNDFAYPEAMLDLIALLDATTAGTAGGFEPSAALMEVLSGYESEFDHALKEHVEFRIAGAREWVRQNMRAYHYDNGAVTYNATPADQRRKLQDRERLGRLLRNMRDVNHRYSAIIAPLLPDELARRFGQGYVRQAIRRYLQIDAMPFEPYVKQVLAIDDLSNEQRGAVQALAQTQRETQSRLEAELLAAGTAVVAGWFDGGSQEDMQQRSLAIKAAIDERIAADMRAMRSINGMLEAPQQQRVPLPAYAGPANMNPQQQKQPQKGGN